MTHTIQQIEVGISHFQAKAPYIAEFLTTILDYHKSYPDRYPTPKQEEWLERYLKQVPALQNCKNSISNM